MKQTEKATETNGKWNRCKMQKRKLLQKRIWAKRHKNKKCNEKLKRLKHEGNETVEIWNSWESKSMENESNQWWKV